MNRIAVIFLLLFTAIGAAAQTTVDKTLETVSDGTQTELITNSDLLWQLALEPSAAIDAPTPNDLKETLARIEEQRLIALEAKRLPAAAPKDDEVTAEIRRIVAAFPSATVFEARLRRVGFDSTNDPNFRRIIEDRLAINKYLDFRFRSFVVITPQDEEKYYNEVYAAQFKQANPGVVIPPLNDKLRQNINQELTEQRVETSISNFLTEAKQRAVITRLYDFGF